MALTSFQFRNQPYWLGFTFAGQAFTVSYRGIVEPGNSLLIQISTGENTITHLTHRRIINQSEQLGIKLIDNPWFAPGSNRIPAINMDGRSKIQAATAFYSDASNVYGGIVLEESMVPRCSFGYGGSPIESDNYERILQYNKNYILAITNEGLYSDNIAINIAFYESGN